MPPLPTPCTAEGPTTLHLHDPLHSAAGCALALRKPLQGSLLNGGATALPAWTDVQQMAASEPGVSHLLCVPFGCSEAGEEPSSANGSPCRQHLQQGSGRGALLFGFSAAPQLDPRCARSRVPVLRTRAALLAQNRAGGSMPATVC